MRSFLLASVCTIIALVPAWANPINGRVVGVSDGDTLKILTTDRELHTVRLNGVDCPEKSQAFGERAKQFTASKALRRDVVVHRVGYDRYGRTLADVHLDDGSVLNHQLVKNGYAWWYQRYSKDPELQRLEQSARELRIGLWQHDDPEPPWEYRANRRR